MDFEHNPPNDVPLNPPSASPARPINPGPGQVDRVKPTGRKHSGWRIFFTLILAFSIMANVLLFAGLVILGSLFATTGSDFLAGSDDHIIEQIIEPGPASTKIAVIRLDGMIDSQASQSLRRQFRVAAEDKRVVAVILRAMTPGGTVSASDQIHHEITTFRQTTGKPVVAFMQSVAASGGYYASVACDEIIAEPTAITGSIGVMVNTMVIQELLEEKLGIDPVIIKSGPRKDWPSMFSQVTPEQRDYLTEKLIKPAYERFVTLVAEGRKDQLTPDEVRTLADGSIYGADEAKEAGLIDDIGYMDKAISTARRLAGVSKARVVEYGRSLSLFSVLGAESQKGITFDRKTIEQWALPRQMYLWDGSR